MPLYEYKCGNCKKIFEELIRNISDESGISCPVCGSKEIKRLMSAYSAFGSSSSVTDYSDDSSSNCPSCGCGGGSCGI
ncbi:MAG: zinc ribbon domain-containing protein [Deltaproteobacteria bacterium]|nr:zinc ribbon domain-containing protein [Deltaproteobacteria bacterium]